MLTILQLQRSFDVLNLYQVQYPTDMDVPNMVPPSDSLALRRSSSDQIIGPAEHQPTHGVQASNTDSLSSSVGAKNKTSLPVVIMQATSPTVEIVNRTVVVEHVPIARVFVDSSFIEASKETEAPRPVSSLKEQTVTGSKEYSPAKSISVESKDKTPPALASVRLVNTPPPANATEDQRLENSQPFRGHANVSSAFQVEPLTPNDHEQYTIRMNTWKREEHLHLSLDHYVSCKGVAQIQIIWCTTQGDPPTWLKDYPDKRVVVEAHKKDSLNERFHILMEPPTAGILSIDDDILAPCLALDSAFFKWVQTPDRMVGFDARGYEEAKRIRGPRNKWKYSSEKAVQKSNSYSLTLTRFAFLHRDYLKSYTDEIPAEIRNAIDKQFNCEDIAMSLWVSSKTGGQSPLLADFWAHTAQVSLYNRKGTAISDSMRKHKQLRNDCMENFSVLLDLKDRLHVSPYIRNEKLGGVFDCGVSSESTDTNATAKSKRQLSYEDTMQRWKNGGPDLLKKELDKLKAAMAKPAILQGLIKHSAQWKKRFS